MESDSRGWERDWKKEEGGRGNFDNWKKLI